jgi:hypothetical protein
VGRNRLRKKGAVRLRQRDGAGSNSGKNGDDERVLTRWQRLVFAAVGGWLQRRYHA